MQVTTSQEAPDRQDGGRWPTRRTSVLDWLMLETSTERFIDDILLKMCRRLRDTGVPVARSTLSFRIQHPQFQGASMLWEKGMSTAQVQTFEHGALDTEAYANSPIRAIHSGVASIRQRIDRDIGAEVAYPIFAELREQGLTEYLAWPLEHTFGRRHVVTFATDREGGFEDAHVALIADLLPALSLVSEIRLKNRFARTILETYVGPHASAEILAGAITRGSGKTVSAAILVCDLRDFATISEMWPRDDVIEILNGYFDAMSEPVEAHGGEILKFMGDGLLAIFPLEKPTACRDLLLAVSEAQSSVVRFNEELLRSGRPALRYGIGIHVGDVMYGNIGSRRRLDFTVIGPAVNTAARLESLTKIVGRAVLMSGSFAELAGCRESMERLGIHSLRGVGEPVEVFALTEDSVGVLPASKLSGASLI